MLGSARATTNRDAAAQGISRRMLSSKYARVLHGVHVHHSVELSLDDRCAAAAVVLPTDATFSDLTALELLGLPLPFGVRQNRPLEVTVSLPTDRPVGRGVRGHRRDLRPAEVTVIGGVRVTTAPRTFIDLAPVLDEPNLIVVGDAALRQGSGSPASLRSAI